MGTPAPSRGLMILSPATPALPPAIGARTTSGAPGSRHEVPRGSLYARHPLRLIAAQQLWNILNYVAITRNRPTPRSSKLVREAGQTQTRRRSVIRPIGS